MKKLSINLASRRHIDQRFLKLFLVSAVILFVLLLGLQAKQYLYDRQLGFKYQSHLDLLQKQLQVKLPQRLSPTALAQQRRNGEQIKTLLQRDTFRWTALLDKMERLLPTGISLRNFKPEYGNNSLTLTGVARDLKDLRMFLDNLESEQFNHVFLKSQSETKITDSGGNERIALSFSISLNGVF